MSRDLRPVYTARPQRGCRERERASRSSTRSGAREQYPAISKLGENTRLWSEFIPFLGYDVEIRHAREICSTNAIESL